MHGDSRRHPARRAATGGAAVLAAGLVTAAALAPASAQAGVRPATGAAARCGEAASAPAARPAAAPRVTAKLPAALRRGAAPTRIDLTVHNGTRRTYTHVRTDASAFGTAPAAKGQAVFLTAKDVRIDQYIRGRGWRQVRLETGCDPTLGQTLWPSGGFTLRPGGTFHTAIRIAITRHASPRITRADVAVGGYAGQWTGGRYRSVRLTG
ncbi:MAG TPA: hypothetical protein VGL93_31035 [Streptosporangiaceae bacterium]|jgi:hypothetical protein